MQKFHRIDRATILAQFNHHPRMPRLGNPQRRPLHHGFANRDIDPPQPGDQRRPPIIMRNNHDMRIPIVRPGKSNTPRRRRHRLRSAGRRQRDAMRRPGRTRLTKPAQQPTRNRQYPGKMHQWRPIVGPRLNHQHLPGRRRSNIRRPRQRPRQRRQPPPQRVIALQLRHQRPQVTRLLSQRQRAISLTPRIPGSRPRSNPLPTFSRGQLLLPCPQITLTRLQPRRNTARLILQLPPTRNLGAQRSSTLRHFRQHRLQRRPQPHGFMQRISTHQTERQRPPRHHLQSRSQTHQRLLALRNARTQIGPIAIDQRNPRMRNRNLRLSLLNTRSNRGGLPRSPISRLSRNSRIMIQRRSPRPRISQSTVRLAQRRTRFPAIGIRRIKRQSHTRHTRQHPSAQPHRTRGYSSAITLHDDTDARRQYWSHATTVRPA